jgi:hypothetical protein
MGIRVLVFLASVLLTVTGVACSEADAPVATTTTPGTSTATTTSQTPETRETPHATPIAEAATLDGCPVDDVALCQFALDAQNALNADEMEFFVSRLSPFISDCRGVSLGPLPGCEGRTPGPSGPVVGVLGNSSDCCLVDPADFETQLRERLDRVTTDGAWRVYAVDRRTDHDRVVIVRGTSTLPAMLSIGLTTDGELGIPTVTVGALGGLYVFPDSEFLYWR